mmetsp:Transcript_6266/g.12746  ORF Transcript_6266/g.12746 Transcript_6266/m.12746 type:complete len:269 (-) Transcript_6266:483-1289(-)
MSRMEKDGKIGMGCGNGNLAREVGLAHVLVKAAVKLLECLSADDKLLEAEDIVDVESNLGQHVCVGNVTDSALELLVHVITVHEEDRVPFLVLDHGSDLLGLDKVLRISRCREGVHDHEVLLDETSRQNGAESKATVLFVQFVAEILVSLRRKSHSTSTHVWAASGTLTSLTCTLLPERLAGAAADFGAVLALGKTTTAGCPLPGYHVVDNVLANLSAKDKVVERKVAGTLQRKVSRKLVERSRLGARGHDVDEVKLLILSVIEHVSV